MITRARRLWLVAITMVALAAPAPVGASHGDSLPDLGMAPITDLRVETTDSGRRLLRFTTVIVNVGAGPFETTGIGQGAGVMDSVSQRIYTDDTVTYPDGYRDLPTTAEMYFAGDGHSHWHVRDLELYELHPLVENPVRVGVGAKQGFCFWDNAAYRLTLPGAPQSAVYRSCGNSGSLTSVTMGLSIGWGDTYRWSTVGQWVDITGLTAGSYRLSATADARAEFLEASESNNTAWVDIHIRAKGNRIRILGSGGAA